MNFFGHDSNASNDPRLKKLLTKYGYEGTGLYWHMIECIARHLDPPREQSCELQEDVATLARDGFCEGQNASRYRTRTDMVVNYMIEVGLFERLPNGNLRNSKVLRRLSDAQKKKVRRTDGQQTDYVRGEVKRSEVEVKVNMNRSEGKDKSAPLPLQLLWKEESQIREMLKNPKYGTEQIQSITANLSLNLKKQKQFSTPNNPFENMDFRSNDKKR